MREERRPVNDRQVSPIIVAVVSEGGRGSSVKIEIERSKRNGCPGSASRSKDRQQDDGKRSHAEHEGDDPGNFDVGHP